MFKLLRYFSITSLVSVFIAAVLLGFVYRQLAINELMKAVESQHTALSQAFANSLWSELTPLIAIQEVSGEKLRARDDEVKKLRKAVHAQMRGLSVVKVKIFNLAGRTVFSTELEQIGQDLSAKPEFLAARAGKVVNELSRPQSFHAFYQTIEDRDLFSSYIPLRHEVAGQIEGVLQIYSDVTLLMANVKRTQFSAMLNVIFVLGLLYGVLFLIVRHADKILKRQEQEQRQAGERLDYLAHHDSLTNLPNRVLLSDRLQQTMIDAQRHNRLVAVLFLDLDRFKTINDTLGHETGDALLKTVAERLQECVRGGDTVARLGGDEFTVVLADVAHVDHVARVAQKILENIARPFHIVGKELFATASIGITLFPFDDNTPEALLRNADVAMYQAKAAGRNAYRYFTAEMNARALECLSLETDLRHALERKELLLLYQPQINIKDGRLIGVEALIRWRHPQSGLISPAKFIPVAEETGLIGPIGEWVLHTACAQNKEWQDQGLPPICVSVNVSARQLRHHGLIRSVTHTLKETGLAPEYLSLEFTESMLIDNVEQTVAMLNELHALGIGFSIDDFGTGYSSLSYLKRFPLDILKIDQSFIRGILDNAEDAAIARAIIVMAHSLGIKTIAEGVETEAQLAFLHAHQCDGMQGYYFSQAVAAETIVQFLQVEQRRPKQAKIN